jgi:hypothetical protein
VDIEINRPVEPDAIPDAAPALLPTPQPVDGITPLGAHMITPDPPSQPDRAAIVLENRTLAMARLQQASAALGTFLSELPDAPGDEAMSSARSQLAFCMGRLTHEARVIGEG